MAFKIITADERMRQRTITCLLTGMYKVGKTYTLKTLPPESTLFLNIEAGDLAVTDWQGASIDLLSWEDIKDVVCLIAGANPARRNNESYSQKHYDKALKQYPDMDVTKYKIVFFDSLTVASRVCLHWCKGQPQAFTDDGKPNAFGVYGLLGAEMMDMCTHLHYASAVDVIFVMQMARDLDEYKRPMWGLQAEGKMLCDKLPYLVDQVMTLAWVEAEDGRKFRALITKSDNVYGYPAGDRSGRLDQLEPPSIQHILDKAKGNITASKAAPPQAKTKA